MTDRELYNYIKDNYKPEKGTAIYFDLRNYHLCGLHAVVLKTPEDMGALIQSNAANGEEFAVLDYFDNEADILFSYKEFTQEENLNTGRTEYFRIKQKIDMEKVKEEFAALASFLKSQAS